MNVVCFLNINAVLMTLGHTDPTLQNRTDGAMKLKQVPRACASAWLISWVNIDWRLAQRRSHCLSFKVVKH